MHVAFRLGVEEVLVRAWICSKTWMASSRVGATTTARMPFFFLRCERRWTRGRPNARVLPLPVSAMPIRSREDRRWGQEEDWMDEGFSNFEKEEEYVARMSAGSWSNRRIGRRVVFWESVIDTFSDLRYESTSACGRAVKDEDCLYLPESPSSFWSGPGVLSAVVMSVSVGVMSSYLTASLRSFLRRFLSCFSEEPGPSSSLCLLMLVVWPVTVVL